MTRWLFSARIDLTIFLGVALGSAALAAAGPALGITSDTPLWAWLLLVVGLDVAHVWSTLFRVYLDKEELARHPVRSAAAPLLTYAAGVAAYSASSHVFWRCLAYAAAWHFVRQQVGWMVLYGRRGRSSAAQIRFDTAAIAAATVGPLVWWHTRLPRPFWWFVEHDFISVPRALGAYALGVHAVVVVAWLLHQLRSPDRHWGKVALLVATWVAWFGGIVLARSDFEFTVMNVALHGVPYLVLLHRYAQGRLADGGYGRLAGLVRLGVPGFLCFLVTLAFLEELGWDRLVWHEHAQVFGASGAWLTEGALSLVVPLLALPQMTHYVLDGFVWRTREDPLLAARLGWARGEVATPDSPAVFG